LGNFSGQPAIPADGLPEQFQNFGMVHFQRGASIFRLALQAKRLYILACALVDVVGLCRL
jgi:hypothetical protein